MHSLTADPVVEQGSLAAAFDQITPLPPPLLMSATSFDHSRRVGALFPLDAVQFFGFECRLGEGAAQSTDCALNLSAKGARLLAADAIGSGTAAWQRIGRFYRRWQQSHADPFADAASTWLEFDAGEADPAPNLLFGYWPDETQTARPWDWMQRTLFPELFGGAYGPALHDSLDRAFRACPPGTGDFQIGVMLSRPIQAVRLCIFDLPLGALPAYLDAIGWAGDRAALDHWMTALAPHCDFIGLHFDVAAHVFPHIGIEPNFRSGSWSRQPHREGRWAGIWQALSDGGVLAPAKHAALLGWTGHQPVVLDGVPRLLLRGLSHVKLVLAADGRAQAKGYFGIALRDVEQGG